MSNDRNIQPTRFGRVSSPRPGQALQLDDRIIGQNQRKQKLTEGSGTNPQKLGGKALSGAPSELGSPRAKSSGYAQDTAPYKHDSFAVGGPGFPKPWR